MSILVVSILIRYAFRLFTVWIFLNTALYERFIVKLGLETTNLRAISDQYACSNLTAFGEDGNRMTMIKRKKHRNNAPITQFIGVQAPVIGTSLGCNASKNPTTPNEQLATSRLVLKTRAQQAQTQSGVLPLGRTTRNYPPNRYRMGSRKRQIKINVILLIKIVLL